MHALQTAIKRYAIILIALVGLLAYANSFDNAFQFDDGYHIVEGKKIKSMDNVLKLNHWKKINNRPLSFFTLAVNYEIHKLDVRGYHITNLLFHVLAGFILFLLLKEILSLRVFRENKTIGEFKVLIALFGAFIFITHPLQTQAVTYIIQRMTVLAGLFYFLSVLMYVWGRKAHLEENGSRSWKPYAFYIGAVVAGILGFLSKQNAVTFPLAFILVEALFIRNSSNKVDRWFLGSLTILVAGAVTAGILMRGLPVEYDKITRSQYLLTQLRVMVKYWQLLFLPVNQHLDYYWRISSTLWNYRELLSLAFHLAALAGAVILVRKRWIIPAFMIFWFYLTLSVESTIIPIRDVIFEHRLYSAVAGFGFGISYLLFYFLGNRKPAYAVIALSVLTLVYAGASLNRNEKWETSYSIWNDSVKKSPKRERAWYWLGTHYTEVRDPQNAMKCFSTSIECNPLFPLAYNGRGNLRKETGDLAGALEDYNRAIELDPKYMTAFYNRGIAHAAKNQYTAAIRDYDRSIKLGNRSAAVYYNRGNAKRIKGLHKEAIQDYTRAIRIDRNYPLAYYNRGLTKAATGDHSAAIADIDAAIKLDPRNHLFYNGKGVSLQRMEKYQEAIQNFDQSLKLNPGFGQAYYNRGYTKFNFLNDLAGACDDWKKAAENGYPSAKKYLDQFCR